MKKVRSFLFQISDELFSAIDAARDGASRNGWLEREIWRLKSIKDGAEKAGVENPKRQTEGRGGDFRSKQAKESK